MLEEKVLVKMDSEAQLKEMEGENEFKKQCKSHS
jgi:hypothetical protein